MIYIGELGFDFEFDHWSFYFSRQKINNMLRYNRRKAK